MKNSLVIFSGLRLKGNIYLALLLHLVLAMALFSVCRIAFYWFNKSAFPDVAASEMAYILLGGLRFDLTAVLYTNALFILLLLIPFEFRFRQGYQTFAAVVFNVFNGIALTANVADFVYYPYTGRRTTADVFEQFQNETNMGGLMGRFLFDYWYAVLFWMALIALMVWLRSRIKITGPQIASRWMFYGASVLSIPIVGFFFVGGARGDWKHSTRPITLNDAGKYVTNPAHISLVLNTPFAIFRTLNKTKIQKVKYYESEEALAKIFNPVHVPAPDSLKKLNVVVLVLESFSQEFMGFYNAQRDNGSYKGYTPFLDSLFRHSRTFRWSISNGRKSIDALPSVVASIPSMGVPYVLSPFSGNKINSLGNLLNAEGYSTSFFHGAPNGSMGFEAFMNIAGIHNYYGMTEYGNDADFDGWWGIWDEKFLGFMANTQQNLKEPFLHVFFSVSSHHPYILPDAYKAKFPEGPKPITKGIQYTDHALRKYFNAVSKQPWYKNTLFVISADHCSSQVVFKESQNALGRYSIPIAFFRPDNSLAGMDSTIAQQVDILPSVLGYVGYSKPFVTFGRDVLAGKGRPAAWNVIEDTYNFYSGDFLLQFNGIKSTGLYRFKTDLTLQENLVNQLPDSVAAIEPKIKAVIQQYNNRMVKNNLTVRQ